MKSKTMPLTETPPPNAAPSTPLKKLSLAGMAKKKDDTKTAYPVVPDPNGQLAVIAARICTRDEEIKALESLYETDKKELRCLVTPFYFNHSHGKHDVASSVSISSPNGEVLAGFQNRYKQLPDERSLLPLLGEKAGQYFKQSFDLKIEGDKLPMDKAEALIAELQALFAKYNATDALSAKEFVKPLSDFHARRHLELTVDQNLAIEEACPLVVVVKPAKGRK